MTAATKYRAQAAPAANLRKYTNDELVRVQMSIDTIVTLLGELGVPIEIGPADSAGIGFRTLRIPN